MRAANTQPSFDLFSGAENDQPLRETLRQSTRVVSDGYKDKSIHDDLKAEIKSLKYTLSTIEQEKELTALRHDRELHDVQRKAEEDFKKMQSAEGEKLKAMRQYESLLKELAEIRDAASNEQAAMDRRLRETEEAKRLAEEEVEEIKSEFEETIRGLERQMGGLESKNATLLRGAEEQQQDAEMKSALLGDAQRKLAEQESRIGNLETDNIQLKSQTGDADTLAIVKRELSEQVSHIRTLETKNREQLAELKHFRQLHKSVEVVEEEKRMLQRKVDMMDDLQQELGEAKLQRQRLEDERLAWTAYLQSQEDISGRLEFESPEDLAKALVQQRLETATLVERLGGLEPALSEKDGIIKSLEDEKATIANELQKLKASGSGAGDSKIRTRLERQRALAIKEAEYLRAQLKMYDTEDSTFQPENFDEHKVKQIQELQDLVDQYRNELQALHAELATNQASAPPGEAPSLKRPREDSGEHEQLGVLSRKNRKLQDELSTLQQSATLLQKELSVTKERLSAATSHSKTRVLTLRDNPTANYEAIKTATLKALREENGALLSQLRTGNPGTKVVPISTLETAQRELLEMKDEVASKEKMMTRLRQVWTAKTSEFRQATSSILGWDVEFQPNGKLKVTSLFYPSSSDYENSILFDGERGNTQSNLLSSFPL